MERLILVKDLFKNSFEIYVNKFWFFVKLILLNVLAFLLLAPAVILMFFTNDDFGLIIAVSVFFALSVAVVILASILVNIALVISIKERMSELTVKQALLKGTGIYLSYLYVSFLSGLAILGGLILFIIPGIIFAVWFTFSTYLVISDSIKGKQALAKSKALVKDYWWAVFGRLVLLLSLMGVISWAPFVGDIVSLFFGVPFGTIYAYLIFEDLKKKKMAISIA